MDTPSLQAAGEAILPPALKAEMPLSQSVEVAKLQTFRKSLGSFQKSETYFSSTRTSCDFITIHHMGISQNWVPQ